MTHSLFIKHEDTLKKALAAIETRGYWSPFPEMPSPKVYGETASAKRRSKPIWTGCSN